MRASEWQFLCAVHESPKSCCAIDYCCHTLDWATNIVTSQKIFPSRLSLGAGDAVDERGAGVKHLTNTFRRLHRIFAHAWFQHRGVFWQVEGQTGLYVLFKTVCDFYDLLPAENYKLPPEAEGLEPMEEVRAPVPMIMKPTHSEISKNSLEEQDFIGVGRTNTRRHIRQSPSVGSAVTTVLESDEEEADITQSLDDLQITEEEEEAAEGETEIPVIVETYEVDENLEADAEKQPETAGLGEVLTEPIAQEGSTSSTSSWDSMSSDYQETTAKTETEVESQELEGKAETKEEEEHGEAPIPVPDSGVEPVEEPKAEPIMKNEAAAGENLE